MDELHEEQQRALEDVFECDQPVFVTGSDGTGNRFLLKETQRRLEECGPVGLAAPTGIAALMSGGLRCPSWALPEGSCQICEAKASLKTVKIERKNAKVAVINLSTFGSQTRTSSFHQIRPLFMLSVWQ